MNGISRYSRQQLIEQTTLSKEDMREISQCRGSHSRLGFAYQIGFVRLRNRFPVQSPFEVLDDKGKVKIVQWIGLCLYLSNHGRLRSLSDEIFMLSESGLWL